jgi:hypothetical protein
MFGRKAFGIYRYIVRNFRNIYVECLGFKRPQSKANVRNFAADLAERAFGSSRHDQLP